MNGEQWEWPVTHEQVQSYLESQKFTFAKTRPTNPHSYIVRRNQRGEDLRRFELTILHMREHGYQRKWWGDVYTQLRLGDHEYWTMGAPVERTQVINGKTVEQAEKDDREGKGL